MNEFDKAPIKAKELKSARYFAASYAGEHVAGTEFVIGAMFVSWGVGATDVILGLLVGNTLAVLTWALICSPIAADTRLTLYAYLNKMAGSNFVRLYSIVNGVLFCILAGAMITVSASAVRILFGIEPQVNWYPTSSTFVAVACVVGMVVTIAATKGFSFVARFAEVSAPWMIAMFFVGAMLMLPPILQADQTTSSIDNLLSFINLAENHIWIDQNTDMGIGHVIAIAWGANLAFHGGQGDMTILRFARHKQYGWFSAIGMFIGHFAAWLAAGVMGAGAGLILSQPITSLDAGEVAFQALGSVGILAVIIAGWTTSNPTIYRAGLAFQSIHPSWKRKHVTLAVGAITTVIACFPFVFTQLLSFLGIMGLVMAPVGGVIFAEHYLVQRLNVKRFWHLGKNSNLNMPALISWMFGVGICWILNITFNIHVLYLFIPAWISGTLFYPILCVALGASKTDLGPIEADNLAEIQRKQEEKSFFLQANEEIPKRQTGSSVSRILLLICVISIMSTLIIGAFGFSGNSLQVSQSWLTIPTVIYFLAAILIILLEAKNKKAET